MVQILREQTRQFGSSLGDYIGSAQTSQNLNELNQVVSSIDEIVGGIQDYNKTQAQNADEQMINTQIGSSGANALKSWATTEIEKGVDPTTEDFQKRLEAKRLEIYQPLLDQMTSDKGRSYLEAQGVKERDSIIRSGISKIAQNRKKAKAQAAFVNTAKNVNTDAREFGKLGDWEGFKEATETDRQALKKYAKAHPESKITDFSIDQMNTASFLLGQTETDPDSVIYALDPKYFEETFGESFKDKTGENLSEKARKIIIDKQFDGQTPDDKLREVISPDMLKTYQDAFIMSKKQEILDTKEQMNMLPKDSKSYGVLQEKVKKAEDDIEDAEHNALDLIRSDLNKVVLPKAKEKQKENKLVAKEKEEKYAKDYYHIILNPNDSVSFPAYMAFVTGDRPSVEKLFNQSVSDEEMNKITEAYINKKMDVIQRTSVDVVATQGLAEKMQELMSYTNENPIAVMQTYMEGLVELHDSGVTQKQFDEASNILYAAVDDKLFGDTANTILSDTNRFYPDMPRIMYGKLDFVPDEYMADIGLPSSNLNMIDKDSVVNYIKTSSNEVRLNLMAKMNEAAMMPTKEQRMAKLNEAYDYLDAEKQKIRDTAWSNYGLDVAQLRENKKKFGQAFTQLSSRVVAEYMGDNPDGTPLLKPLTDYQSIENARKRVLNDLESSKKQSTKKAE